jgi:hypothetical protein
MRRHRVMLVLAGAAAAWWAAPMAVTAAPVAGALASVGTWGKAIEVPGLGALNKGANLQGGANVTSLSCGSPGNCAAGGFYRDGSGHDQGFVVSERNGTWRKAIEVPGLGALNKSGAAQVSSVSCGSAGNCAAAGSYLDGSGREQAFLVGERNGAWGKAIEVPGLGVLNAGGSAQANSVSCASAGNCAAGGSYTDGSFQQQAFVVGERNGAWGKAIEVPGSGALNVGGGRPRPVAQVNSVSCASAGNCAAGGFYTDGNNLQQPFVASERNGTWGKAIEVPGLNSFGLAQVSSVSCGSRGNCAAGGNYFNSRQGLAFVVSERNGTWRKAINVPGLPAPNPFDESAVRSVSCGAAGNCAAGGYYTDRSHNLQAFVVNETNGTWRKAIEVPGTAALNKGGFAQVWSVSCATAGNCAAGGVDVDGHRHGQAFVVNETNGTWRTAIEVPGSQTLNKGGWARITSLSCRSAGKCAASGLYTDRSRHQQGFVASQA